MIDRGRRELGSILFQDSTVAQPMYPLRGMSMKEPEVPTVEPREESVLDKHIAAAGRGRDDPGLEEHEHDRY